MTSNMIANIMKHQKCSMKESFICNTKPRPKKWPFGYILPQNVFLSRYDISINNILEKIIPAYLINKMS